MLHAVLYRYPTFAGVVPARGQKYLNGKCLPVDQELSLMQLRMWFKIQSKTGKRRIELLLSELRLSIPAAKIFRTAIIDRFGDPATETKADVIQLTKQINDLTLRSTRARNLLLAGDIDGNDYKEIKSECEKGIRTAEARSNEITSPNYSSTRVKAIVARAFDTLSKVDRIYKDADDPQKRRLIGSIFVEKFTFEDLQHRTAKMAECFEYIFSINRKL